MTTLLIAFFDNLLNCIAGIAIGAVLALNVMTGM